MIGAEKTMKRAGHNHWWKRMVELQAAPNRLQAEAPRQRRHAVTGRRRQAATDYIERKQYSRAPWLPMSEVFRCHAP